MTIGFSSDKTKARKPWNDLLYAERNCHPKSLHVIKIIFKNEGEIKTFSDKRKFS